MMPEGDDPELVGPASMMRPGMRKETMIDLAKVAYDAYCESTGGVSLVSGAKLPPFHELKDEIKRAWDAAAQAVAKALTGDEFSGEDE